jgi:hypothetical protein
MCLLLPVTLPAQLRVNSGVAAEEITRRLIGPGVKVSNIRLNCPSDKKPAFGYFTDNTGTIGISDGLLLSTGAAENAIGPNNSAAVSQANGHNYQDPDLATLLAPGDAQFDACVLEFDVQVFADTLQFDYVFASEEYMEFIRDYHDVFGFFISGPGIIGRLNLAVVPGTDLPVSVQNINRNNNAVYYIDNGTGETPYEQLFLQYDGLTRRLSSRVAVVPCGTYSLKLAICDVKDDGYDAGIFLAGKSLQTRAPQLETRFQFPVFPHAIEGCNGIWVKVKRQVRIGETAAYLLSYSGTALRNSDYGQVPDSLFFQAGENEKEFFIPVLSDSISEQPETLRIALRNFCPGLPEMAVAEVVLRESFDFELPDQRLCEGREIVLNPSPRGNYLYQWSPPDGLSCSNCPSPVCRISADTVYRCSIREEASGCRAADSVQVKVFPSPRADFSVVPEPEISSLDFRFQNLSENSDAWFWQLGDGSVSSEFSPSHYYQAALNRDSALYEVGLVAVNSKASCSDTLIKTLEIGNPMFIPNLVIRRGQDSNNSFAPRGILSGIWSLRLFDRYGTKIFENAAYQLDWNGSTVRDGVYFYQLSHPATGRSFRGWLELGGQE